MLILGVFEEPVELTFEIVMKPQRILISLKTMPNLEKSTIIAY